VRFCVTDIREFQVAPVVYSGPDVMTTFYNHVMRESEIISGTLMKNEEMNRYDPGTE